MPVVIGCCAASGQQLELIGGFTEPTSNFMPFKLN